MSLTTAPPASATGSVIELSTTFTPASTCNNLAFSSPAYFIWYDEPVPLPSSTATGCYPSEWLAGYQVAGSTSSIAPLASPLICPQGWTTAWRTLTSYIACCPTSYNLHYPDTTVDSNRPAYGGKCFSDITSGQTLTITEYGSGSIVQTQTLTETTAAQAYAHVIDGIDARAIATATTASPMGSTVSSPPLSGILASSAATSGSTSARPSATAATVVSAGLSGGAIAGIVIGVLAAFITLAILTLLLVLRRRMKNRSSSGLNSGSDKHSPQRPGPQYRPEDRPPTPPAKDWESSEYNGYNRLRQGTATTDMSRVTRLRSDSEGYRGYGQYGMETGMSGWSVMEPSELSGEGKTGLVRAHAYELESP